MSTRMNCLFAVIAVLIPFCAQSASLPELLRSTDRTGLCEFNPSWVGYLRETAKAGPLVFPITTTNRAVFFNAFLLPSADEAAGLIPATLGEKESPPVVFSGRTRQVSSNSSAKTNGNLQRLAMPEQYQYRPSLPSDQTITAATNEWQLLKLLGPTYGGALNLIACNWSTQSQSWRLFRLAGEQELELLHVKATLRRKGDDLEIVGIRVMRGMARSLPVR